MLDAPLRRVGGMQLQRLPAMQQVGVAGAPRGGEAVRVQVAPAQQRQPLALRARGVDREQPLAGRPVARLPRLRRAAAQRRVARVGRGDRRRGLGRALRHRRRRDHRRLRLVVLGGDGDVHRGQPGRQQREPVREAAPVALRLGRPAQPQDLPVRVGHVAVLAEGRDIGQRVRRQLDRLRAHLVDHDQQIQRLQRGAGRVLLGVQQHRIVARDQQRLEAARAGRRQHLAHAQTTLARRDADVAQPDAVGLGRQHVQRGGRGLGPGQRDREVGRGARLRPGLRRAAPRGRDDDRRRTAAPTQERGDGGIKPLARRGADVGQSLNLGERGAQIHVAQQPRADRLRRARQIAVRRMNRVRLIHRVIGQRVAPRRDAHQRRPVVGHRILDPHAQHVVGRRDVVADRHDQIGGLDRGQARGQMLRAESVAQRVADRRGHGPQRGVEVGHADPLRERAQRVQLFRGRLPGTEHADRGGAVLGEDRAELGRGVGRDRAALLLEGVLAPPDRGRAEPILVPRLVVAETPPHANLAARDVVAVARPHLHAATVAHAQLNRAAHRALRAGRRHPLVGPRDPLVGRLHQRGRGADIDARAAEVAVGLVDLPARAERDARREAAPRKRDRGGVPQVVAGPHAARADDAHLRVELEERVGAIRLGLPVPVVGARLVDVRLHIRPPHIRRVASRLQLAAVVLRAGHAAVRHLVVAQANLPRAAVLDAVASQAAVGVVGQNHRQHLLAHLRHRRRVRAHHHPVRHLRRAGQRQPAHPLNLHRAGAAARIRRQPVQVAQVRDRKAGVLDHLNQRRALRRVNADPINHDASHRKPPVALRVQAATVYQRSG